MASMILGTSRSFGRQQRPGAGAPSRSIRYSTLIGLLVVEFVLIVIVVIVVATKVIPLAEPALP